MRPVTPTRSGSRARRALPWLGALIAAGVVAASIAPAALAGPPATRSTDPNFSWTPTHKDLTPGETWTNSEIYVATTKVMPKADLIFVVDRTGSMDPIIEWVADGLAGVVANIEAEGAKDINIGVVTFDDRASGSAYTPNASPNPDTAYAVAVPFGAHTAENVKTELYRIAEQVRSKTFNDGGDLPEDATWAMMRAASETNWRPGALHNMIVVTDAGVKYRTDVMVDGYPVTTAGAKSVLTKYGVEAQIQTGDNKRPGADGLSNDEWNDNVTTESAAAFAGKLGLLNLTSSSGAELTKNVSVGVIDANPEWTITNDVKCAYESDGAASDDLTVVVQPNPSVIIGGETGSFTETAVASATADRVDDATVCTIQMYLNGVTAGEAGKQTVRTITPRTGQVAVSIKTDPVSGTTVKPGSTVTYTITSKNDTNGDITAGDLAVDLTDVLDDATIIEGSLKTDTATRLDDASLTGNTVNWAGALPIGATTTVTFQAKVADATTGNSTLGAKVSSIAPLNNCAAGSVDPACATTNAVTKATAPVITTPTTTPTVTATPTKAATGGVATTGSDAMPIIAIAFIALSLGATALIATRRRLLNRQ